MAQFLVLKPSSGAVPQLGDIASADIYFGDHADGQTARTAAANKWGLGPTVALWSIPAGSLTPGATTVTST